MYILTWRTCRDDQLGRQENECLEFEQIPEGVPKFVQSSEKVGGGCKFALTKSRHPASLPAGLNNERSSTCKNPTFSSVNTYTY